MSEEMKAFIIGFGIVIAFVLFLGVIFAGPFAIVGAGERGVLMTWGQVEPYSLSEGFHWKIPIMQRIELINVKTLKKTVDASAASKDLQVVTTTVALNYRVQPDSAHGLYQEIGGGYEDTVIAPAIQESVKAATAKFTAEQLITQRPIVKANIETNLKERLASRYIDVQNVSITNFDFSAQFNAAIEAKVTAEQEAFKAKKDLERIKVEAEQRVTQAKAESDAKKLQADADAYEVKEMGKATAEALRLQRAEIDDVLNRFKAVEKWSGDLPTFIGGGVVPFLNVESLNSASGEEAG